MVNFPSFVSTPNMTHLCLLTAVPVSLCSFAFMSLCFNFAQHILRVADRCFRRHNMRYLDTLICLDSMTVMLLLPCASKKQVRGVNGTLKKHSLEFRMGDCRRKGHVGMKWERCMLTIMQKISLLFSPPHYLHEINEQSFLRKNDSWYVCVCFQTGLYRIPIDFPFLIESLLGERKNPTRDKRSSEIGNFKSIWSRTSM